MPSKPAALPRWATDVTAVISEPSSGAKDVGWTSAQSPPASWMNWLQNLAYQWCAWLDAFESTAHTWTATQTFGITIHNGDASFNSDVFFGLGNVSFGGPAAFGVVSIGTSLALTGAATATFAGLATFNGASVFNGASTFNSVATFANSVALNAHTDVNAVLVFSGTSTILSAVPITFTGANPAKTDPSVNKLSALHLSKAFAHIACNGTTTTTLLEGLNMNAAPTQSGAVISVVFKSPMADANYAVIANVNSGAGSRGYKCEVDSLTVNGFNITLVNDAGTFPTLGDSNAWKIVVDVKGRQ